MQVIFVTSSDPVELRAPRMGRSFFRIENLSGNDVYWREDIVANSDNGNPLSANETVHFSDTIGQAVPQGSVWIIGTQANPQKIIIKEQSK